MREPAVIVVTCGADGYTEARRDVAKAKALEAHQLHRRPLPGRQPSETGADNPAAFFPGQMPMTAALDEVCVVERFASVCGAPPEGGFSAECPMVGVLKQPAAHGTTRRIVELGAAIHFEKHLLCDVFCLRGIIQDVGGNPIDEAAVAIEQRRECVAAAARHLGQERGIGLGGRTLGSVTVSISLHTPPLSLLHSNAVIDMHS